MAMKPCSVLLPAVSGDALLDAPLLRGRVRPHPLFGPWDGFQWLLATGSHTARHNDQIREIKADVNFPGSPSH